MKFTKMSLVAALLIGSSAFAIDNVKVSGDANVYYQTSDANNKTLLEADSAAADIGVNLNVTADLVKNDSVSVSTGAGITALTTLGLENNLVNAVWGGAHTATANNGSSVGLKVKDAMWVNEAWLAVTVAKTTAKVGRMALDTPLAFTETWSIEKNTFDAAVLINQDIPDTTLVGAFVGNGNGTENFGIVHGAPASSNAAGIAPLVDANGKFNTYGTDGAYAIAAINNSWKPLTVQAWYYDVTRVATASWLQADLNLDGILVGAQYSGIAVDNNVAAGVSSDVYALMAGYTMKDTFTAKVSYSQVGKDFSAGFNTATANGTTVGGIAGTAQSKLYTEAWWNYGKVTQADSSAFNVTVEGTVATVDLGAYYTQVDQTQTAGNNDLSEITITATKSMGPLDATVAYINATVEDNNPATDDNSNTIQAYLTLNF